METLRFRDLKPYECFDFATEQLRHGWYVAKGPWRKISARKYVHVTLDMPSVIGSIDTEVVRVNYSPTATD